MRLVRHGDCPPISLTNSWRRGIADRNCQSCGNLMPSRCRPESPVGRTLESRSALPGTKNFNDHVIIGLDHQTIAGLQDAKFSDHDDHCPRRSKMIARAVLRMRTCNHQTPLLQTRTVCGWRPVASSQCRRSARSACEATTRSARSCGPTVVKLLTLGLNRQSASA
jgi:hypothetical protein